MKDCQITHFLKWTLPLAATLVLTGCAWPRVHDVTSKPAWWGELRQGEVVELKQDTLLSDGLLDVTARKFTRTGYHSEKIYGPSITVEMFRSNRDGFWNDLYLLPKGTRLRCVKLERWFSRHSARTMVPTADDMLFPALMLNSHDSPDGLPLPPPPVMLSPHDSATLPLYAALIPRFVRPECWFWADEAAYRVSAEILDGEHKGQIAFFVPWGNPLKKGTLELGPHPLVRPVIMATASDK